MRKRKPPYILLSMLIFLGAMLFFVSGGMAALAGGDAIGHAAEAEPVSTGQARPTDSRSDIARATSSAANASPGLSGGGRQVDSESQPSIKLDKPQDYKPVPNDSSTSSGWFYEKARDPKASGG